MKDLTKEMHFEDNVATTLGELERLANRLLNTVWTIDIYRHSLAQTFNLWENGWRFEYNTRKKSAGLCSPRKKTIYLSKYLVEQNLHKSLEFENTLRHELAHAIDFEMRGKSDHSRVWKAVAREVLCTAERCYKNEDIVDSKSKYTFVCTDECCNYKVPSHKKVSSNARSYRICPTHRTKLKQIQNY